MPKGATINAFSYSETLKQLQQTLKNQQPGKLSKGIVLCMAMQDSMPQM